MEGERKRQLRQYFRQTEIHGRSVHTFCIDNCEETVIVGFRTLGHAQQIDAKHGRRHKENRRRDLQTVDFHAEVGENESQSRGQTHFFQIGESL